MNDYKKLVMEALEEMELSGQSVSDIDENKNLLEQGLDSLDMMDLYFKLEEKSGKKIEFNDDTTQHAQWSTIADIAEGLAKV